jgi:hypothetical protein
MTFRESNGHKSWGQNKLFVGLASFPEEIIQFHEVSQLAILMYKGNDMLGLFWSYICPTKYAS